MLPQVVKKLIDQGVLEANLAEVGFGDVQGYTGARGERECLS